MHDRQHPAPGGRGSETLVRIPTSRSKPRCDGDQEERAPATRRIGAVAGGGLHEVRSAALSLSFARRWGPQRWFPCAIVPLCLCNSVGRNLGSYSQIVPLSSLVGRPCFWQRAGCLVLKLEGCFGLTLSVRRTDSGPRLGPRGGNRAALHRHRPHTRARAPTSTGTDTLSVT